jgi:outer membrane lipoprotein
MKRIALAALSFLLLSGCAHVLTQEALSSVDPTLDYARVKADPEAYKGRAMVVGGMILDTRVEEAGTTLEVFRYSLDRWGKPQEADEASGRFLAKTGRFLDPGLYAPGQFITLAGVVEGRQTRPLQGVDYAYPVFRIAEAYVRARPVPYYVQPYLAPYDYDWGYPYPPYRDPFWYGSPYPYLYWPPGRRIR